jgi:hypothetical protein
MSTDDEKCKRLADLVQRDLERAIFGDPAATANQLPGLRLRALWRQASIVHEHWPLRLSKVLSAEAAEFVPASGLFGEWVPKQLPAPPYELSPDDLDPRGR